VLKLSAWGARFLHERNYKAQCSIHWLPDLSQPAILEILTSSRKSNPSQTIYSNNPFNIPKKLWKHFINMCGIDDNKRLSEIGNTSLRDLSQKLASDVYTIDGKTTNKEEFVTCGGVSLNEVNFKTLESRLQKGLYFAGEILDIDGVTGGFNFQNAWTNGWIAGNAVCEGIF
jgi:predicted Rossmann fold flavoprotein